jgi:hypothetical protein
MTVILEEVDGMDQTFKGQLFINNPLNGSIVSLDRAEEEMNFDINDDEDDQPINAPPEFKKINEILDNNKYQSNSEAPFDDGTSPRQSHSQGIVRNSIPYKKTGSDKTDAT